MRRRQRKQSTLGWPLAPLVLLAASLPPAWQEPPAGQEAPAAPPAWVEIEPNAIQRRDQPMRIEVGGLQPGERVLLTVLRDHGSIDASASRPPLLERLSAEADAKGIVRDEIVLADLETREGELDEIALWLQVRRPGGVRARWTRFGYVANPCSLWATIIDAFFDGDCDPGLAQALRQHRGPSTLEDVTFEVRWIDLEAGDAETVAVVDTRGATGVAWVGPQRLLVTIAPTAGSADGDTALEPGLYRFGLADEAGPTPLWRPSDAYWPTAPYPLPGGRVAFVRQRLGAPDDRQPPAYLSVLDASGRLSADHPLHHEVHQIVAYHPESDSILALTLGEAQNRPAFLRIGLSDGEVEHVGYHHALYHAAMRSPAGDEAAIAFENTYGDYGWDLVLVDEQARLVREVETRVGHDLLPAWRPDGGALAYLAEVREPPKSEEPSE